VGVAHDGRGATLDHVFQLVEAAQELVVELLLREQLLRPTRECPLGLSQFFRERGDGGLWVARQLSLEILDPIFEPGDEAQDGIEPLVIEPADGGVTENGALCARTRSVEERGQLRRER
jgi:hypothetical protein